MKTAQLLPFPQSHPSPADNIKIVFTLAKIRHEIRADFALQGDTTDILWPAPAEAIQGVDLWKHTCFELFIAAAGSPAYWEYNFSPSRQWTVYAFEAYRKPIPLNITSTPTVNPPQLYDNSFSQQAHFALQPELIDKPLAIGAAAVIETTNGQRKYYALHHCGAKPDFHLRESFVLEMG